jgi:hypothetical protein
MPGPDKKTSIRLSGGLNNRTLPEFVDPAPVQGSEPQLVKSTNTRLGKLPGGVARSPRATQIANVTGFRRYGLVPSVASKKTTMTGLQAARNLDIVGDGISGSVGGVGFSTLGRPIPLPTIVDAGEFDAQPSVSQVAQCYEPRTGLVWRAVLTGAVSNAFVGSSASYVAYVSASYPDGRQVATMSPIVTFSSPTTIMPWIGLSAHPLAGMFLWTMRDDSAVGGVSGVGIYANAFAIAASGYAVVPTSPSIFVTNPVDKTVTPDLVQFDEHVFLAAGSSVSASDVMLTKFQLGPNTITSQVTLPSTVNGKTRCALNRVTQGGQSALYSAVSREGDNKTSVARWSDALASLGAPAEVGYGGTVTLKQAGSAVVLLVGSCPQNFTTAIASVVPLALPQLVIGTAMYYFAGPTGVWASPFQGNRLNFLMPLSHGFEWADESGVVHAIVPFARRYGRAAVLPGETDYADDPSIVLYDLLAGAPVARFGCVRGNSQPVMAFANDDFSSRSDFVIGDRLFCGWRKIANYTTTPYYGLGRYTVVDMVPKQLTIAHDRDGATLVASAMSASYDGGAVTELGGSLFSPHIAHASGLVAVGSLPAGMYRFLVIYEQSDASGLTQRSRPSNLLLVTIPFPGASVTLSITQPQSHVRSAEQRRILVYASVANGTSLHFAGYAIDYVGLFSALFRYSTPVTGAEPNPYTVAGGGGEEIAPQPAPPLRDVAIVGQRAMGVDAEFPTRIAFTKIRVAGIGYEWYPAGELHLPSEAGEAMAVREWNGLALILAQMGCYQVSGDGPNNNASAGAFFPPVKISDIGCSNTASVVEYPGGMMWQHGNRFVRIGPAGIAYDKSFLCTHDVSAAVCMPKYEEVLFFSATTPEVRVYHYGVDRWTTWDSETLPELVTMARALPWDEDKVLVYSDAAKVIKRIDTDSVSAAAHMTFETDWLLLDADFQSHVILREVIFSGAIVGPHGLELEVFVDYEATPSTTHSWSSTVLAANATSGRYTVKKEPVRQDGRAFKVRIRDVVAPGEANSAGMSPRAVTLIYAVDGMQYEEVFNADMRQ